jgi:hypothetical protein
MQCLVAIVRIQTGDYAPIEGKAESPMGRSSAREGPAPGKLRESVAARVRKIDGADEGNRDQEQDSGEEGIDDHISLPKNSLL